MRAVSLRGGVVHTIDRGEGQPLLLVHGFPLDHSMWCPQIDALENHCRVIAPDLPGFGRSPARSDLATMADYAKVLHELLDALDVFQPVTFCGLSMGGYIGWEFWRHSPTRVARMILCDTRAIADTPQAAATREQQARQTLEQGPAGVAHAMLPKLFAKRTLAGQPAMIEQARKTILGNPAAGIAAALRAMAVREDVTNLLPTITQPALLIVGEHDAISTPEEMRGIADQLPNARWLVVPEAGHMSPLENPTVVNDAITSFLTEQPAI